MVEKELEIIWSNRAVNALEKIYDYYLQLSPEGAENVKRDVLNTVSSIKYLKQYQVDEINSDFRRMSGILRLCIDSKTIE